jgi:hypothetical protein
MSCYGKLCMGLVLLFTVGTTRAGILLTGNATGFFQPVSNPNVTTTNTMDGLNASFRTGVPVDGSFKSGVKFNGHNFANLVSDDTFALGLFTYYNGVSRVGTSSGSSLLDLYVNFDDPSVGRVHLTTITFGIDATVNTHGHLSPDAFTASFLQPSPIWLGDELVKFTINGLPTSMLVAENAWTDLASITVTILIPETSTYAAMLGVSVMIFALVQRRRILSVESPAIAG